MSVSVVLPAYKEAENLRQILPDLKKALLSLKTEFEILVIDTEAPMDDTFQVCKDMDVNFCPRTGGNNYGDAIRTGISKAKSDIVVFMDCDGSHDSNEIPLMIEKYMNGADIVIGSRYVKGGRTDNSVISKLMSWMVNTSYRLIFGLKVKDVSNGFRVYNAEKLKSIELKCDNFDIVEEILILLKYRFANLKVIEHPIYFKKRNMGESKRHLLKFIKSYIITIVHLLRIKRNYKRKLSVTEK